MGEEGAGRGGKREARGGRDAPGPPRPQVAANAERLCGGRAQGRGLRSRSPPCPPATAARACPGPELITRDARRNPPPLHDLPPPLVAVRRPPPSHSST